MLKDESKKENLPAVMGDGDGFDDVDQNDRLIQGTILRCVDGVWSAKDGTELSSDLRLLAGSTALALQHWEDRLPIETIVKRPGEPLQNVDELNKKIPQKKWEKDTDGNPRPPWVKQYVVYLLDPETAAVFTFINNTKGAEIAVERLKHRVKLMRTLRGNRVVPVVKLDSKPMPTQFGVKQRPEFTILDWRELGGSPSAAPAIEQIGKPVKPVSLKEEMNDSVDDI
jgi:hypothetical protein